ncbi:MAG: phage tail protein [Lachnospiraceae bacterium]|nr:phage tail protein [Lachnospiraceae bacterium]
MPYKVNFQEVETTGLESSPVAEALAGLRANEARYLWNKYKAEYITYAPEEKPEVLTFVEKCLAERDLHFAAKPLAVALYDSENLYWPEVYYKDGLCVNVLYEKTGEKPKRAVGLKLSVGMEIPKELEGRFKFARQKSKLAGEVRGSFFVLKGTYL